MRRRLAARLGQSIVVVFIVTTIAFFVIRAAPGDPFSYEDSSRITPEVRAQWRAQFGYDKPLIVQYGRYLWSVAHGQLGYSVLRRESVAAALAEALPRTLTLAGLGLLLSLAVGIVIGTAQAARRGGWFDRITSFILLVFYSLPDFWGALIVLLIFAYWWRVFPPGGLQDTMHDYLSPWAAFTDRLKHLVLPLGSLVLLTMAAVTRYQRGALLEVLPADYVRTARAKGVSETRVVWRHALRTALAPVIVLLGVALPGMLGGTLFVEKVFGWPGIGMLAANAIGDRDYDLVTATVIVGAVLVVVGNLLADALHVALDPRVRE
jgi:peptide/nickel transport system permease protein